MQIKLYKCIKLCLRVIVTLLCSITQKCEDLARAADQLISVMMWQYRTHPLQLAGVSDAFRLSINRILQLKGLVMNMDNFIRERELGNAEDDSKSEAL